MFLGKTDFKLNSMKNEGYVYQCVLAACAENSIYEINEMGHTMVKSNEADGQYPPTRGAQAR